MVAVNLQESPYSIQYNTTDQGQIKAANNQNVADMGAIQNGLNQSIAQGLGLYNNNGSTAGLQGVANQAQGLMGQSTPAVGNVDFSNYNSYMTNGAMASDRLASLSGLGANPMTSQQIYSQYLDNPAVQAQTDQGNRQINSNFAQRGGLGSGALLKALDSYGQGVASQGLQSAQNQLFQQAQLGSQTANQYAASLLGKYTADQNATNQARSNQVSLLGAQNNAYSNMNQGTQAASGFLSSIANNNATLQSQAASNRLSALTGAATKTSQTNQFTNGMFSGLFGTQNSSLSVR